MRYAWLSYPVDEKTPLYGTGKGVSCKIERSIAEGDSCNTMKVSFSSHAGTHLDVPRHFFLKGKTVEKLGAGDLIFNKVSIITAKNIGEGKGLTDKDIDIGSIPSGTECLLLKTGFCRRREKQVYWRNSPYITAGLAGILRSIRGLKALGIDFISVGNINNRAEGRQVHKILLSPGDAGRSILIIEDMDLRFVKNDINRLYVFPIRIRNADGGPCSVAAEIR